MWVKIYDFRSIGLQQKIGDKSKGDKSKKQFIFLCALNMKLFKVNYLIY